MKEKCDCSMNLEVCPDQRDIGGGSQYPNMPCGAIVKALESMDRRIEGNSDCSIEGLSPIEREAQILYTQGGGIYVRTVVELILNE